MVGTWDSAPVPGTAPRVMWRLLHVWTKQGPHSLLMRETGPGPWKRSRGCTSQTSSDRRHRWSGVPAAALKSLSALAEANRPTGSSPPMTEGGGGPKNKTFLGDVEPLWLAGGSVSGSLWPCPSFLHWKYSSHLPSSLLLKTDGRPTSPAPWSVPGGHFSKDWAYHSLSQSFVADAPSSHMFRFRKLVGGWWWWGRCGTSVQILLKQQMNQKDQKKTKKCLGNFQRACPHWAESVLRYGMFRGKQAGKWPLPQACLHGQPSVRRSAFPKQQSSPWSLSLCLSFSTSLGFQKLWSKRVVSIDLWTACDREEATSYEACLLKKYLCWYLLRGRCQRRDPSLPVSVIWRKNRFRKHNPTCFHCLSHRTSLLFPRSPAEHTEPCMTTCWGSEENYHLMESPPRVRDTWQGRWSMETLGLR